MQNVKNILKVAAAWYVFAVVISLNAFSLDNLLTNGDFEDITGWGVPGDETLPAGWTHEEVLTRKNPALQQSGVNAIGGSGTSAFMGSFPSSDNEVRRDMWNMTGGATSPSWTVEFDFASEDPGAGNDRSVSGSVEVTNANRITFRVSDFVDDDGIGEFQVYDVGTWQTILTGAVVFDNDVSTTPVVNHVTFTGRYYEATPVYDVTITNSQGTYSATDIPYHFYSTSTKLPTGAEGVNFSTFLSAGDYLLDNVVLAEKEPNRPAQYIVNGDFENTTGWGVPGTTFPPYGWTMSGIRTNAAAQRSGSLAIGGSGTSAYMEPFKTTEEADRREIRQEFSVPTSSDWQFDVDLAAATTSFVEERSFTLELVGYDGGTLFLRVVDHDANGVGDLEIYSSSTWQTVTELDNSIVLDAVLGENPSVNHLTIVGRYADDTPFYDVLITDANDIEFSATDLSLWVSSAPSDDFGGLQGVAFNTFNSDVSYMIDNVSLVDIEPQILWIPGDANHDGNVDVDDAQRLAENWGYTSLNPSYETFWEMGDFDGDEMIGPADAAIMAANWGYGIGSESSTVPEPSTLIFLGIGVLAWLPLRRPL
ncbi:MAG: PEP-CTERM sorting domain-containing protein [Pirellulales bacterium]|nr:PEP-CTERM sorting domain-containing protein [Pirellulales bacterium]